MAAWRDRGVAARVLGPLAFLYAASGVAAMWLLAPRVPYADAWRHLARYLHATFPFDVLAPDNGHQEILPNLVRVAELRLFAAGQWLQVAVGIVLALATAAACRHAIRDLEPARRATAWLAVVLGLFWLGNVRVLAHGNESVHAYGVTLFLAIGLGALSRAGAADALARTALASACGLAAAFSFGSGIAAFPAFAVALSIGRASWRQWLVLAAGLAATVVLMRWNGGAPPAPALAPLRQADLVLRWLAGPFVYAAWPLLDPQVAAQLPVAAVRAPALAFAEAYQGAAGPVMLARWPQLPIAVAGLACLGVLAWKSSRRQLPAATFGVGLACFAAVVGLMIGLVRADYFAAHPEQLLAPRYVVWSSLFWAGLMLAGAALARKPARMAVVALVVACCLLPSQLWMARLGMNMRAVAGQGAVAAAVGVVPPGLALGETVPAELAAALPPARAARVAVFAWPEAQWLGRRPPRAALQWLQADAWRVREVGNRLGAAGREVRFSLPGAAGARVLLVDADGVVRGLATPDRDAGDQAWIGWMRGSAARQPRAAILR